MNQQKFPLTRGVPALRISGSVYHNIGAIYPNPDAQAKFMQCFFYDGDVHANNLFHFSPPELAIHSKILQNIELHNPFLQSVRRAIQDNATLPLFKLIISDQPPPQAPTRTYNRPTTTEISAIVTGDGYSDNAPSKREVVIHSIGGGVNRIASTHSSYDPLSYVLTHMHGTKGWTYDIPKYFQTDENVWVQGAKCVTAAEYYAYRMHTRDPKNCLDIFEDTLAYGGMLKQQFDCDNWIKIEEQRLNWQRHHQKELKAESYIGLADAVAANEHRQAG